MNTQPMLALLAFAGLILGVIVISVYIIILDDRNFEPKDRRKVLITAMVLIGLTIALGTLAVGM